MPRLLVRDWMSPNPICVSPDTTLPAAQRLMLTSRIRHLPILSNGRILGLVNKSDIRQANLSIAATYGRSPLQPLVTELETVGDLLLPEPAPTIEPDAPIGRAAELFLQYQLDALLVVAHGQLVGILTESDLFRFVLALWEESSGVP